MKSSLCGNFDLFDKIVSDSSHNYYQLVFCSYGQIQQQGEEPQEGSNQQGARSAYS